MDLPRVYAIVPVRDYADVLEEVLANAAAWATRIFVMDNGSTDGSVAAVERAADRFGNIEFLGVDRRPWSYGYYALIYQRAKKVARPGDWWYRLDADEMVVGDPRPVLEGVASRYDAVRGSFYNYYFTPADLAAYESDPGVWLARPVADRIRWYRNDWAEARFVRHARLQRWKSGGWRDGPLSLAPETVQVRQYRYRSPEQIARRLEIRTDKGEWAYETADYQLQFERPIFLPPQKGQPEWCRMLADQSLLDYDDGSPLRARPELLPPRRTPPGPIRGAAERLIAMTPLYRPFATASRALEAAVRSPASH